MTEKIYLLQEDGTLRGMEESRYDSERLLQQLLANYPDLLAGEQINEAEPRRWVLVSQEAGVPDEEGGSNRWSLDHLFLDQEAIPTLVEVKRRTDTRIRREVVGQMLDYAANAVAYWPVEEIRARFNATCEERGIVPEDQLADLLSCDPDDDGAFEAYWVSVKTNLQAGRIRLVFVADLIPSELRTVVEFLNGQMDPAEVLAVEVRQFVGDGIKTLVPKVMGVSARAQQKKGKRATHDQWTAEDFFRTLEEAHGAACASVAKDLLEWVKPLVATIKWGHGAQTGAWTAEIEARSDEGSALVQLFSVRSHGQLKIPFQRLRNRPGFGPEATREELRHRLNAIEGVDIPEDGISRRPSFPLAVLLNDAALARFKETVGWMIGVVKSATVGRPG